MTTNREQRWPLWPWLVLTLAGLAVTVTAAIVGNLVTSDPDDGAEAGSPATVTLTAIQIQPSTVTRTVTATVPPVPADRFDDGLFAVGVEVVPGTFHTNGPDGSNAGGCYWSRRNPSGDVIANGVLRTPGTVTMSNGESFDSAGCQPWQLEP